MPHQRIDEFVVRGEKLAPVLQHGAAALAQRQSRGVLEHRRAHQLLETADLQGDRRLRASELFRGAGKAAAIDDSDESSDDVDRQRTHGNDLWFIRIWQY